MINEKKETKDDNPPLNELNSFKFDQNIFNQPTTEPPKKKGKGKKPKAIDFMDYAQSKGISINIQYEDKQTQPTYTKDKKDFSKDYSKPYEQKKIGKSYNEEGKKDDKKKKNDFEIEVEKDKKRDKVEYDAFNDYIDNKKYDGYYKEKDNYYNNNNYNRNYYNNNNYEYNTGKYKKNYYDYDNNYDNYNNYNNYDDYYKKKKNQIAVEVPDPNEQNNNSNSNNNNNKNSNQDKQGFSKVNKFDKPSQKVDQPFMFPQDPNFINFQAMMRNNMFNPLAMPVNPFIPPHQTFPIRDEEILDIIEYFFSQKNLNKDIYLRDSMDEEGWVNAEIVIANPRLKPLNLTPERIHTIIDKIGSDFVETRINEVEKIQLRPRNYENLKEKLLTREEIQQKMLAQMPPNVTQPPMGFTPPPMYPPMMNMYMQRPPINPMMFQQMQMGKMPMPMVPVPQPKSEK